MQAAETARSAGRPTADLTAYDLYLRSYAMVLSSARQTPEALRLTEQAIARDPRYGPALAWAAVCCIRLLLDDRSENPDADRRKGEDFARRSLEVAGDDPGILVNAANALVTSVVMPDVSHFRNLEHRELFLSGLHLAMGETV